MGNALTNAIHLGHNRSVRAICEEGAVNPTAEVGGFMWSPLYHAARKNTGALEVLLEFFPAIDLDQQNSRSGWTALHGAVYNDNEAAVRLLLSRNASTNIRNRNGETPEELGRRYGKTATADIIAEEVSAFS